MSDDPDRDPDPALDGPLVEAPAGMPVFEWALHVSQALQLVCGLVGDWQALLGVSRLPTLEELQGPPFNCTWEFAWRFLRWAQIPEGSES